MAHRILNKPSGILLSSRMNRIAVQADGEYFNLLLSTQSGKVLLNERYYAYAAQVTDIDLSSLIETEMRSSGKTYADFIVRIITTENFTSIVADSHTYHILYCDRSSVCTNLPVFLKENFLTTLNSRRISEEIAVSLYFYAKAGESVAYAVNCCYCTVNDDTTLYHQITRDTDKTATTNSVVQIVVTASDIMPVVAAAAGIDPSQVVMKSFVVSCGARAATFFIDRSLSVLDAFFFTNCFNIEEYAFLPIKTTVKTDVTHSTAVVDGKICLYNRSAEKSCEVTAGPLSSEEADWIDQLFTSFRVSRLVSNDCDDTEPFISMPVLITDSTCEISDADDKINSVKFTWRYDDSRPLIFMSASPGIFTEQFDYRFT